MARLRVPVAIITLVAGLSLYGQSIGGGIFGPPSSIRTSTFTNLGTPTAGNVRYCTDCTAGAPCTGSGTGAFALRVGAAWNCLTGGASGGGTIGGNLGASDNAVLRADGTGGVTAQGSTVSISDTGNITIPTAGRLILAEPGGSGTIDYALDVGMSIMDSDLGVTQQHDMSAYTGNHTVQWPDTNGTVAVGTFTGTGTVYVRQASPTLTTPTENGVKAATSTKTSNYTLTATDYVIIVDATSGGVTITLPAASASLGQMYRVQRIDGSANTVQIARAGSDTINGDVSYVMTIQYESVDVVCTSTSTWGIF